MNIEPKRIAELLENHLPFYINLDKGNRQPVTEAQKRFVRVCRKEIEAVTEHEVAYMAYRDARESEDRMRLMTERVSDHHTNIPEFEEGTPRPGWTDESSWRRMKQQDREDWYKRCRGD